ncbi:MAG: serine/threonine protein kinase [Ignavibacteria bacterium]|nr:serine/threonine protein kinase [Ignavibacteria bacterium]
MIGQTLNSYKILSKINEGGMGVIYLAKHKFLERNAAIKVLKSNFSKNNDIKERFFHEAKTLSMLDHPYIVKIMDFDQYEDNFYIIMEYVEGITLEDYVGIKSGLIPEEKAKELFIKILSALGYAHSKEVVHRDIKPSNIIIDSAFNPKILDFGIARLLNSDNRLTKVGGRMGSPLYMSPEQCLGKETDFHSDIFSIGVTLYEALTAKHPFENQNDSDYALQSRIINENPFPPTYHYPVISKHMEFIISTALSKNPYERFNSCYTFIDAFNNPYFIGSYNYQEVQYSAPPQNLQDIYNQNNSENTYNTSSYVEEKVRGDNDFTSTIASVKNFEKPKSFTKTDKKIDSAKTKIYEQKQSIGKNDIEVKTPFYKSAGFKAITSILLVIVAIWIFVSSNKSNMPEENVIKTDTTNIKQNVKIHELAPSTETNTTDNQKNPKKTSKQNPQEKIRKTRKNENNETPVRQEQPSSEKKRGKTVFE